MAEDLNMYIEEIKPGFPDCIGRRFLGKGWLRVSIEFEYKSSNFQSHGHDKDKCDIIVCWEHDWTDCPIEVIELKSVILEFENYPIKGPGITEKQEKVNDSTLDDIFKKVSATANVKTLYEAIFKKLSEINDNFWLRLVQNILDGTLQNGHLYQYIYEKH